MAAPAGFILFNLMADHERGQLGNARFLHITFCCNFSVPQYNVTITDFQHFLELVRNKNYSDILIAKNTHHLKNALNLRDGQRRCRFIHDNDGSLLH